MALTLGFSAAMEKPFTFPDVDRKELRKHLRPPAAGLAKAAKKLVGTRGVSKPGDFPGLQTGTMQKSITPIFWKSGWGVTIAPKTKKILSVKEAYYPAFVVYGHRAPRTRTAQDNRRHRATAGVKVAKPRANFMVAAVDVFGKSKIQKALDEMLENSIKPIGVK